MQPPAYLRHMAACGPINLLSPESRAKFKTNAVLLFLKPPRDPDEVLPGGRRRVPQGSYLCLGMSNEPVPAGPLEGLSLRWEGGMPTNPATTQLGHNLQKVSA